jgi:glyoxalase superfamily protein
MPVTDPKTVKNRVNLDLTASAGDRDQEIGRLLGLGARQVHIRQTGAESWTVLADPEGTSSAWYARRKRSSVDEY